MRGRLLAPFTAFLGLAALSLLWAHTPAEAIPVLLEWAAGGLVFWVARDALARSGDAEAATRALALAGVLASLLGLGQYFFNWDLVRQAAPPAATFMNRNLAAGFVASTLPFTVLSLVSARGRLWPIGLALAAQVAFLFHAFVKAGWLAFAVETGVLLYLLRPLEIENRSAKLRTVLLAALLVLASTFFASSGWAPRSREALQKFDEGFVHPRGGRFEAMRPRLMIWANTLAMIRDHPILGVGLGNHKVFYPLYSRSGFVDENLSAEAQLDYAHNDLLQVASELGLVGLGLLGFVLFRVGEAWRASLAMPLWRPLVAASSASIAAIAVDAAVSFPLEQAIPPLVLAINLAVLEAAGSPPREEGRTAWGPALLALGAACALGLFGAKEILADQATDRMLGALSRKDWPVVRAEGERARHLDPLRREGDFGIGRAEIALGRSGEAIAALQRVVDSYPYFLNAVGNLGFAYAEGGDLGKAETYLRQVLQIRPDDARAHYGVGRVAERRGDRSQALTEYRLATEGDPLDPSYPYRAGLMALSLRRLPEAAQLFEAALSRNPALAAAEKGWGVALLNQGRSGEALDHFQKALELDPAVPDAAHMRDLLSKRKS